MLLKDHSDCWVSHGLEVGSWACVLQTRCGVLVAGAGLEVVERDSNV